MGWNNCQFIWQYMRCARNDIMAVLVNQPRLLLDNAIAAQYKWPIHQWPSNCPMLNSYINSSTFSTMLSCHNVPEVGKYRLYVSSVGSIPVQFWHIMLCLQRKCIFKDCISIANSAATANAHWDDNRETDDGSSLISEWIINNIHYKVWKKLLIPKL